MKERNYNRGKLLPGALLLLLVTVTVLFLFAEVIRLLLAK